MRSYIALARKDVSSDYGIDFPDFPGCITAGSSLDEARAMAEEALDLHIAGMLEDGETLPEPQRLEAVMAEVENRDAVAFLIDASEPLADRVQVSVTLGEKTLQKIDDWVANRGWTRSSFFERAALDALNRS